LTSTITNAGRVSDAEPYARRCVELAERVGEPVLLARSLFALAQNQFWLGRGLPTDLMDRALELDPLCGSMSISARPISSFAFMCLWAGDLDRARTLLDRARQIGYERGDSSVHGLLWFMATLEWLADRWQRSLELANELCDLGTEAEYELQTALGFGGRAVILSHLGNEEQARDAIAEAARYPGETRALTHYLVPFAVGLLELSLGRPRQALEHCRPATADSRARGIDEPAQYEWFPIHVEAAIACGELEEAEELLEWVEERAARLDRAWALACGARCRGLVGAVRGDEAAAVAAFARAIAAHERGQGRRFELARTLLAQGETLRRFKRKRGAREAIETAIGIFDELGAKLWSAKARRELARISGRTRADGLTESELRVAGLVAAGRSNKEIASELFVTVRTVETHLTRVYAKLGVHSRTELLTRLLT